ncbi:hypothetical protein SFRURICE_021514 [Spodoptera frugiperda]|nr:hypothetical protein SFRURICE_021514 [Spodoptera frugiperda]
MFKGFNVRVHRPASYAPYATDVSLSCIETHKTASTDPHRTDRIISNAYMRCILTSYGMRTMRAICTMRAFKSIVVMYVEMYITARNAAIQFTPTFYHLCNNSHVIGGEPIAILGTIPDSGLLLRNFSKSRKEPHGRQRCTSWHVMPLYNVYQFTTCITSPM